MENNKENIENVEAVESKEAVETNSINQKEGFLKTKLKSLKAYFKNIGYDIKRSISENPNIIFGLCLIIPAILIGFMLSTHISASFYLSSDYTSTGFQMFVLEMAGCLNVAWAFGVIKKRNLKSSIWATICTAILVVCGILWCRAFIVSKMPNSNGELVSALSSHSDCIISFITVIISCLFALVGTIGSFFFIDKNYKKETM